MTFLDRRLLRVLLGGACVVVIVAGARNIAGLLNPVLMAGFLALLLQPMLNRLRRLGGGAVFLVVLTVILAGLVVVGFIGVSLRQLALELPNYQAQLQSLLQGAVAQLETRGIDAAGYVEGAITGQSVGKMALAFTGWLAGTAGSLVLTLFIFAFMLGGMWELERRARTDAADHSPLAARFLAFSDTIQGYMGVRALLGLVAALLNYLLLLALGVDYAGLWGVLSFILSFVPNIGFALSMLPPLLLALLEKGWVPAVIVFAGYQVINTVIDNVVGPRFIGRQMKISALLSFLSVLFWAWVLGPTGAILSVPLTVLLRDLAFGRADPPDVGPPAPVTPSTIAVPEPPGAQVSTA
ncbi:MAG TPA: AI-2E family transporter [Longimicrobium sp.]|nr:AI-2E family transporter [Longimicrobium sp.]